MISKNAKIYIAGHRGMVGSACWRILQEAGYTNLIGKTSKALDLRNQQAVDVFLKAEKPEVIIDAAARVGGILANDTYPYEFLMDNMLIQNNLIGLAHENNVKKFIFLGSSCIYPKFAPQPIKEEHLLTDSLEATNQWYAVAKISGVKLIEALRKQYRRDYISLMPTNLYGPNDNFDLETSHVLPAMIRKFHEAKEDNHRAVKLWGSGKPFRDFLYVSDLSKAILFFIKNSFPSNLYNVGYGKEIMIVDLAKIIQKRVGHKGKIIWDKTRPDGTMNKLLDSSKINSIGWKPEVDIIQGIDLTYKWFMQNINKIQ